MVAVCSVRTPPITCCVSLMLATTELIAPRALTTRSTCSWMAVTFASTSVVARAGDAGRGFAVVANEVKELAAATARATTDVDSKVTAIQEQVARVVTALGAISDVVESINETQSVIGGVLTEQTAVTKAILD